MSINQTIFEFLDGRTVTLDGVHGELRYESYRAVYPYEHVRHTLVHKPSEKGQRSKAYLSQRRELGDDWQTDLTNSIERTTDLALQFGFDFETVLEKS